MEATGTHWTWKIVSIILNGKEEIIHKSKTTQMLEAVPTETIDGAPSPRVLNSHLNLYRLPREALDKKCKIVLILRDPRDVAVSLYHHCKGVLKYEYDGLFENFLPLFLEGKLMYNSYLDYVVEWEKAMEERPEIHLIYYEDLKTDSDSSESNIRTPLLGSQASNSQSTNTDSQSARHYNPRENKRPFETYTDSLTLFEMITVPVTSIDTNFKDQAKQYNDAVDAYKNLQLEIHNLKTYFVVETSGIPVLKECLQILASRCGVAKITIERKSRTFIEVYYDQQDVSENCTVSPEQVLVPLRHYKIAFKHAHDVLHHMPEIKEKISVTIHDEQAMLRETAEVDPMRDGGAEGMRAIMSNIKKLKQMNLNVDDVQRRTEQTFKELIDASKLFFV